MSKDTIRLKPRIANEHNWRMKCIDKWSIRNFGTYQQMIPQDEFFFATFGKFGTATANKYLLELLKELRLRTGEEKLQCLETRTNLTQQFVLAALRYPELKYADFKQFVRNSIIYSFMSQDYKVAVTKELEALLENFEAAYSTVPSIQSP